MKLKIRWILKKTFSIQFCQVALTFGAFLCSGYLRAAPDCTSCSKVNREIASVSGEEAKVAKLLEDNKKALAAISPGDVSKRIKITSNLMILSAKVETEGNKKILKTQQFQKMECQACPKT